MKCEGLHFSGEMNGLDVFAGLEVKCDLEREMIDVPLLLQGAFDLVGGAEFCRRA